MRKKGTTKTPPQIVEILQAAMKDSNQIAVASAVGISQSALSRFLRGQGEPTLAVIQRIASFSGQQIVITINPETEEV